MSLSFSQACENNKAPILSVLTQAFKNQKHVLEIGSGTGQHAVYFAEHLPQLHWQTSDLAINHLDISERVQQSALNNLSSPLTLDLNKPWPSLAKKIDGIFTANTLHIVSWLLVEKFFQGVNNNLAEGGILCIYGPFNYHGKFTSESNANFDLWLKDRDKNSGIRDIEAIIKLAENAGLALIDDHAMPANNRLLTFKNI